MATTYTIVGQETPGSIQTCSISFDTGSNWRLVDRQATANTLTAEYGYAGPNSDPEYPQTARIQSTKKVGVGGTVFNSSIRRDFFVQRVDGATSEITTKPGHCIVAWTVPHVPALNPAIMVTELARTASMLFYDFTLDNGTLSSDFLSGVNNRSLLIAGFGE